MISITDKYGSPMVNLGDDNWISSDGEVINLLTSSYIIDYYIKNIETDRYISISEYKKMLLVEERNNNLDKLFS